MNAPVSAADILAQASQARGVGASQATAVEQSRAIAEVQGALVVAQQRPRDRSKALNEALESCRTHEVAEGAFFKFSRGGSSVSGESIHLARELARCWGNIVHSVVELDRDDVRGRSEMMAYAWDLETNARSQITFIVPHMRDKRGGGQKLVETRDIYENNANMGARRLRECIFAVLPPYLIKAAAEQCRQTLESGVDEKPMMQRIAEAMEAFEKIGVSKERIEAKLGPVSGFTAVDIANLQISYKSIKRNEIAADDEFPRIDREDTAAAIRDMRKGRPANTSEGPAEEQRGEAHAGIADAIITEINQRATVPDVNSYVASQKDVIASLDTDDRERIAIAQDERAAEIKGATS